MSSEMSLTIFPSDRCGRISGLFVEASILLAKMDIRAPRANRGAGLRGQGCYRPDAVSARPMGHLARRSLSISSRKVIAIDSPVDDDCAAVNQPPPSRPPTSSSGPRRRPSRESRSVPSVHAASGRAGRGSNSTSRVQTAQTIRPSLFATAIVALL
jgi:hypothetical protein